MHSSTGMIRTTHGMRSLDGRQKSRCVLIWRSGLIWFDLELCGLCFANPNQSRQRVKIVRLEGNPERGHPLKSLIASLALTAVTHFAQIIGCRQIEIQEPVKGAIAIYQQLGFEFDTEGRLVMLMECD